MANSGNTIFIIDDDVSVRDAIGLMLGLRGYAVAMYADAESFLAAYRPEWTGCLLLDIRMPGISGLELQARLAAQGCGMPVIIMTGHGDVDSARQAFRARAVDFLEKPLDQDRLFAVIEEALQRQATSSGAREACLLLERKLDLLTPREREVMELVVAGRHNRDIAAELDISVRTVEVHKARLMGKLETHSIAELVRLRLLLDREQRG